MQTTGKRRRATAKKTTTYRSKPFRAPRKATRQVIPGLLKTRGEEKKVLFTNQSTSGSGFLVLNATGTIQALNLIQVGSSMFNRIGRRVEMISIRLEANIAIINATRASLPDYGRILVVYDRQTNGAYPAITDVLQDTDQLANNTTSSLSGLNMNNRERFVTILDKRMFIPGVTNTATVITNPFPTDTCQFQPLTNEYRKLFKLTTHYKADSNPAVVGDISTGGLYIISLANLIAGTENFQMAWNARLKYVDI